MLVTFKDRHRNIRIRHPVHRIEHAETHADLEKLADSLVDIFLIYEAPFNSLNQSAI